MSFAFKRLLDGLQSYGATLIGTFPLGLHLAESDLDIACSAKDLDAFEHDLKALLRTLGTEASSERLALTPQASVARIAIDGVTTEVFCQTLPVTAQSGFRHMVIEGRLLVIGGDALRLHVLALKRAGMKTEPAFARLLGLEGDPYETLLALESWSHDRLANHVAAALSAR